MPIRSGKFHDVLTGRLQDALQFHVVVIARCQCSNSPANLVAMSIERLAFAGARELSTFRQRGMHRDVFGGSSSRIPHPYKERRHRAGVFRRGPAPVDFKFGFAAEDFLRRFGFQAAIGRGGRFDEHFASVAGRELDFQGLARARGQVAKFMAVAGFLVAAGR